MGIVLLRVDDRLIHGQVVEGWLRALHVTHVAVVSDAVSCDETQKALYLLAVPQGIGVSCSGVREACRFLLSLDMERERLLVLVSTPQEALTLVEGGVPVRSVNIGGLHFREGRMPLLRGVSVDDADIRALRALAARGVTLEARALPLDEPVDVLSLLNEKKK